MNRFLVQLSTTVLLTLASVAILAQDGLPYKEGQVVIVTSVRTQPGSYSFYSASPKTPDQPDLYIVEVYPNMAVFDTVTEKLTAIGNKIFGSLKQADAADANREEIRKILGTEMIRELLPVKAASATE